MSRSRSPKYPSDSLPGALERVKAIFEADRQNPIDREAAAIHMGYSGISGASDKTLSNLMQYGLLERVSKGEVKVSDLAKDILYPALGASPAAQMHEAAFNPPLFAEFRERFDSTPSRETLKTYLKREGFVDRAINPISSAFLETCSYLEQNDAYVFRFPSDADGPESGHSETDQQDKAMEIEPQKYVDTPQRSSVIPANAEVFNFLNGEQVALVLPATISADEFEDFQDWLNLMARRAKRRVSEQDATEH